MKIIHPTPINRAIARRVRGRHAPEEVDRIGAGPSPLHPDLVSWVGDDPHAKADRDPATRAPSAELLFRLVQHLQDGETHYTPRPGLVELRRRVAAALTWIGVPNPGVDGVVITSGEGEALFATLLSLEVNNGGRVRLVPGDRRHAPLLTMMGVEAVGEEDPDAPRVVCLWRAVASPEARCPAEARPDDLFVGTLDGLPGMPAFRLGFAAGPPERIKKVMTWKQAWSICSPAPSQQAALFAFEEHAAGETL